MAREIIEVVVTVEEGANLLIALTELTSAPSLELSHPRSCNVMKEKTILQVSQKGHRAFNCPELKSMG
jgi:hypothetical protein